MAPLRCAAKFDPFLSLDCAPTPSTLAQSKERKGSNFAIWQPCTKAVDYLTQRTPLRVMLMIFTVWVLSGLISIPPLLGWKVPKVSLGVTVS